jgi:hypothetical protein
VTIRDRCPTIPLVRLRVLSSAVKDTGKPRVYGYVGAGNAADADLLTCWTYEQGWLISKIFTDEQPGFGPGMSALLDAVETTDAHAVIMLSQDSYARAIARRIERAGTQCLVLPTDLRLSRTVPS